MNGRGKDVKGDRERREKINIDLTTKHIIQMTTGTGFDTEVHAKIIYRYQATALVTRQYNCQ